MLILLWLLLFPLSIGLIDRIFDNISKRFEDWRFTHFQALKIYRLEIKVQNQVADLILLPVKFLQGAAIFLVFSLNLLLVFSIFPQTREIVQSQLGKLLHILVSIGQPFVDGIPNIVALIIIAIFTYYTLRFLRFLSDGFKIGIVKLSGIHPDLVKPTFQIIRFLVIYLALVAAYPYIPGSDSPAFCYISIFIGFLFSLGSTSLVSNIVAGIVLTYMRGMKVGDRVQIADTVGDVVDRTLLVTRICTIKNVVITIPNGLVRNSHIINFSTSAEKMGLILNTCVTIGYDVPWRQVHILLIEAARATEYILEDPAPFVFQTSLNDYYVAYELNAYTRQPEKMAAIYSELHQNIQDYFNAAGVEILSPAYSARTGCICLWPLRGLSDRRRSPVILVDARIRILISLIPDVKLSVGAFIGNQTRSEWDALQLAAGSPEIDITGHLAWIYVNGEDHARAIFEGDGLVAGLFVADQEAHQPTCTDVQDLVAG